MFGLRINYTNSVWTWLEDSLPQSMFQLIVKVQRIMTHRGDFPRYDVLVGPKDQVSQEVLNVIIAELNNRGCWARMHIHHRGLRPSAMNATSANAANTQMVIEGSVDSTLQSITVGTLNVNSIKNKKAQVVCMMETIGLEILLLQETCRETSDTIWALSLPGCRVFEQGMKKDIYGARGLATAVKSKYAVEPIGTSADNWLFVRVFGNNLPNPVIIGNVYIPRTGRRGILQGLAGAVQNMRTRYPNTPIMIGGDWNCQRSSVLQWIQRHELNAGSLKGRVYKPHNSYPLWMERCRGIDHFVTFNERLFASEHANETVIRSKWDISDHCVISHCRKWRVSAESSVQTPHVEDNEKIIIDRKELKAKRHEIAFHNYWQPLSVAMDNIENADDLTSTFVEESYKVLDSVEVRKRSNRRRREAFTPHFLKRKIIRLNRIRDAVFGSGYVTPEEKSAYLSEKKSLKKEMQDYSKGRWLESIRQAVKNLKGTNSAQAWKWLKHCIGKEKEPMSDLVKPIAHENGTLLLDADEVRERWARHFQALAADPTGHSQDKSYWENEVTFNPSKQILPEDQSRLDSDIEWIEMAEALRVAKNNKATGLDMLPMEFYKSALEETEEGERSPFSRVLEKLVNFLWRNANTPEMWMDAVLVSIPKGGDSTICDNYRGISLMDCGLKVLAIIIARRLGAVFDATGFLIREQVGFRVEEETMSQVCALVEACGRRKNAELHTFITFVDLRKAYDTVPHEALFVKMEKYGVGIRTMTWLRALYSTSSIRIRCGSGLSPRVSLNRGLRQGCPLSPILFDIFIDDCIEGARSSGARIPGCDERLPGLLFADDLAIIAGSPADMSTSITSFESWCNTWEMSVGIAKCGVMGIGEDAQQIARVYEWPTLQGGHIPRVDGYLYLGCQLDYELNPDTACKYRERQGGKVLGFISRMLATGSIPIGLKRLIIKVVLIPCLVYGAEWFGMNAKSVNCLQGVLNKALRLVIGASIKASWVPIGPLMTELGIEPIHVTASKRRARAFLKYRGLKSWISLMINNPVRSRKRTWVSNTKAWMKRLHVQDEDGNAVTEPSSGSVGTEMLNTISGVMAQRGSWAGRLYQRWGLERSNKWYKFAWDHPQWSWGATVLLRCRMNSYWVASRLARAKLIDVAYRTMCPMCQEETGSGETVEHMLFECAKWDNYRSAIQPFLNSAQSVMTPLINDEGVPDVYLCCGGTMANGECIALWERLVQELNKPATIIESNDNEPLQDDVGNMARREFVDFISFLNKVHVGRWIVLSQLRNTTGQSPHGYDGADTAQAQLMEDDDP